MSEANNKGWVKLGAENASIGYFDLDSNSAVFTISGGKFSFTGDASTIAADSASDTVLVNGTSVTLKTPFIDTATEITINGATYNFSVATAAKVAVISDNTKLTGSDGADTLRANGVQDVTISGGAGNDYIAATDVTVSSGAIFNAASGTNTIQINDVLVNGGNFSVSGGSDTDLIELSGVTVTSGVASVAGDTRTGNVTNSGKDTINVENVIVNAGKFTANGRNSDALVTFKQATVSGGEVSVLGSAGNDTLEVADVYQNGGSIFVNDANGTGSISAHNIWVKNASSGGFDIKTTGNTSDNASDTIYVSNVTVGGGTSAVWFAVDLSIGAQGTGTQKISVSNASIGTYGTFNLKATDAQNASSTGTRLISVSDITVQGGDAADTSKAASFSILSAGGNDTISVNKAWLNTQAVLDISAGAGADTISVESVTVETASRLSIDGGAGADTISVKDISANGAGFYVYGGADADSISLQNITLDGAGNTTIDGGAGNDTIKLSGVNVNGGTVNAYIDASDTFTLDKITVTSGLFNLNYDDNANNITVDKFDELGENGTVGVYAGAGDDTISVSAFTVSNGTFNVFGDAGADSISFSGFTVSGGNVNVDGGDGADTVNLSNITVTSGAFNVYGNGSTATLDSDFFNIANVTGVSIISGEEDSDTFALDTTSGTFVSIAGLGATDKFSIASFTEGQASISTDGVIVIGKASIAANGITNADTVANSFYGVSVKVGTNDSLLGDLIDPKAWDSVAAGTFTWGRDYGDDKELISISGGWNSSINADTFENSLKSAMSGDTLKVNVGWLGEEDLLFTAKTGASVGFDGTTVRAAAGEWATISGTEVKYINAGNFAYSITAAEATGGVSTIDAVDQRATLVTISGAGLASNVSIGNFDFNSQTNVASLGAAAFNTNGEQISVFGAGDSLYTFDFSAADSASIGGNTSLGANIAAGSSSINILGSDYADTVAIGAGLQNISVFGGAEADVFNIDGAGAGTITANGGEGDDTFNITNGINITVIGGAGADTFSISGGNNISISSGDNDSDTFAFNLSSGANITIGGLDTVDVISLNQTISSGSVTKNGVLILGNATITANNLNTAAGFASLYNVKVYNGADETVATALGDLIDTVEWRVDTTNASIASYGRQFGTDSDTIVLKGLANAASQVATLNAKDDYISGTFVTFDSDVLKGQTTPITLTSSIYHAALDEDSKVVYNPESYSTISTTSVAYKSANTVAGYEVVAGSGSDTINYIAEAGSEATISGLATDFDLSAIQFGDNVFTISAAALGTDSNTPVTLNTAAGYTLTVGADVSGSDTRTAYWLADASIATFYGQGTVAGYNVAADKKSIVYTAQADATKTIEISGLKGISASNNSIAGITLSEDSTVTIAKTIIEAAGASISTGTGYNYALGGKGALISNVEGGVTLTGSTSNDSLTNKGGASVLEGGKGNDVIVAGASGDTISAGVGNDSITLGNGKDSVFYSGGNDVITGYAASDTVTLDSTKSVREASFDGTDLIVKLNSGKITFKSVKDTEVAVGENIYKNNLIYNADKTELTLNKSATSLSADDITASIKSIDASNVSTGLTITSKNTTETTILGGKGTDYLTGAAGADSLDGGKGNDTLNGGAGNDTLTGDKGDDVFIYSGGKDVITDYGTGKDIINVAGASVVADSAVNGNDVILTFDSENTLTLTGAAGAVISMTSGSSSVVSAQIYGNHSTMNTKKTGVTLGADYNDSGNSFDATSYSSMITIDGSAVTANTTLKGNAKANKIYGGDGNDMLIGGEGNDTLTGNAGSDTFVYSAGKDVITDFDAAADKISLTAGVTAITNATYSGDASDTLILTINKQTLKIEADKDASLAGKSISIDGKAYTFDKNLINDGTSVTMYSAFKGTYAAADGITNVNGSAANGAMNITGTSAGDTLYGGKKADTLNGGAGADLINGGAGNDSIYGGAGKDTLFGGAGKDIFVFGADEGEDIIEDYTAGEDKIKLINGAEITATAKSGEADIEFTIGTSGKVIVKNAAGKAITVIDANGKTTTQIYESASARTLDLLYDNNFMTDDAALDDITEAKYSVTDIETDSKDELEKAQALLTFSEDK